jgi:hypothetical protein
VGSYSDKASTSRPQLTASCRKICEEHSHPLAMLHRAFFTVRGIDQDNLPPDYVSGDVLLIDTVRLKSQYRGYGIGLLTADELVSTLERELPGWGDDGMVVIDPTAMNSDLTKNHSHGTVQEKLNQYWELLGLRIFVRERRRHCTFVGHWMGETRPDIRKVVPHLFHENVRRSARLRDAAAIR